MAEKPKVKIKDYEFTLEEADLAMILTLRELTHQLKRLNNG